MRRAASLSTEPL